MIKKLAISLVLALSALSLAGCVEDDAQVVSHNLSKAADNFEVNRRIVFYNGITNQYMLEVVGLCSMENLGNRLAVTCKVGNTDYKKHYLGLSDNVTYFSEQVAGVSASAYHYRVTFKPQTILPDVDLRTSLQRGDLPQTQD